MTEEQQKSFEEAARPLIKKWLCENVHPHHSVIVTPTSAELLEGSCTTGQITDYLRDWRLTANSRLKEADAAIAMLDTHNVMMVPPVAGNHQNASGKDVSETRRALFWL